MHFQSSPHAVQDVAMEKNHSTLGDSEVALMFTPTYTAGGGNSKVTFTRGNSEIAFWRTHVWGDWEFHIPMFVGYTWGEGEF